MNKTAAAFIVVGAVLGLVLVAFLGGVQIREWHNESQCAKEGGVALWQSSGPTDSRPDGMLPFVCAAP